MFFYLAKVAAVFIEPLNALALLQLAALICLWTRRPRAAKALFTFSVAAMLAVAILPIPELLLRPLEHRVRAPAEMPSRIHGIVLLGGAQKLYLTHAYGKPALSASFAR